MKLAIITGGSKGLGESLVLQFSAMHYQVFEFSRSGASPNNVKIDMSYPDSADNIFSETFSLLVNNEYDEIVAVNNAATLKPIGPVPIQISSDIAANLNINFVSQIFFIKDFISKFQDYPCRKTLVNISSGAALKGYSGWSLYCASKAGMDNYIRCLAMEQSLKKHPITAFNVDPFIMDIGMQLLIRQSSIEDFPTREKYIGYSKNGILKSPSEVASAIVQMINNNPQNSSRLNVVEKV